MSTKKSKLLDFSKKYPFFKIYIFSTIFISVILNFYLIAHNLEKKKKYQNYLLKIIKGAM